MGLSTLDALKTIADHTDTFDTDQLATIAAAALARIAELEAALRALADMERDRYACGAHWREQFDRARLVLGKISLIGEG